MHPRLHHRIIQYPLQPEGGVTLICDIKMTNYNDYKHKIITAKEAVDLVKDGDEIVTGLGASEGRAFLEELHTIADEVKNVRACNCLPMTDFEFFQPQYKDKFSVDGWFYTPVIRKMHKEGNASFIPNNLHRAATDRLLHVKPNIFVNVCSSVDKHGYVSLSTGNTYERAMLDAADISILEINPNFPRTFGDLQVHVSEVDYFIEADYPVPSIPDVPSTDTEIAIGQIIADLIHDGDTIQLGIGGIPNAVAGFLYEKKDLGVHTEMLTSEMARLAQAGIITGKKKNYNTGKMTATFVMGDQNLYDFVDDNTAVQIMRGSYTNDPYVIMRNDNMVSINTAIEVDVTGQVSSESIGSMQISGTGGQADTARGAQKAKNGRSIIALRSTAMVRNEEGVKVPTSTIVPILKPGAIVSLQRQDVDMVVTEYGVASLRGTSVEERVKRLTAIAHPDFRDNIVREALERGIVGRISR